MKLAGATVNLLLSADGSLIMEEQSIDVPASGVLNAEVRESEDLGLWIRVARSGKTHFVLVRWDHILSVDMPGDLENPLIGLKGIR